MKSLITLILSALFLIWSSIFNICFTQTSSNCELITFGLVLHLESDIGITENAGSIAIWADQSGQGNDLEGSGDPQLITSGGPNGQNYISLDGINDKLERFLCLSGLPVGNADRSVFFVSSYKNSSTDAGFVYGEGSPNNAFGLVADGNGKLAVKAFDEVNDQTSETIGRNAGWLSQSVVLKKNNFSHYQNGTLIDSGNHLFDTGGEKIVIGADLAGNSLFSEMEVAAVLVFNRALSEIERQRVEKYLQEKYFGQGCNEDPVIYNVAVPEDPTCNGDNAEFTVYFNALAASGNYEVIDLGNSNSGLPSTTGLQSTLSGFSIGVAYSGPTASSEIQIDIADSNDPSLVGDNPVTVTIPQCPSCSISNIRTAQQAVCDGENNHFTVFFDVNGGSGNYQIVSDANDVLASITDAPRSGKSIALEVEVPGGGSSTNLTFEVVDAESPLNCLGENPKNISLPACQQVPSCIISNVSAPIRATCSGNNAQFAVTFDVSGGSGNYQVLDINTNQMLGSVTGDANAVGLSIPVTVTTSIANTILVDVIDAAAPACASGRPSVVSLPSCPVPSSCELLESKLVFSLEADQGITASGGVVSVWNDQTGSNHLSAVGDPTLEMLAGPNGQPYIAFDGNEDKMERTGSISGLPAGFSNRTIFLVARYSANNFTAGATYGTAAGNQAFGLAINTDARLTVEGYGTSNDQDSDEIGLNTWLSQSVVFDNFTFKHYRDGRPIDSGNHTFNTMINKMILAGQIDNSGVIDMDIAAVFIYEGALTEIQRQQVEAFIQTKYFGKDCPICNISNVAVLPNADCDDNDARFTVTFDVNNGSGNYEVFNTDNPTEVLGTVTGAFATAEDVSIEVKIPGPATQSLLKIDVRDTDDPNCIGGLPQRVVIPTCPAESSVQVAVKVMLQGPFDNSSGLMADLLRTKDLIPVTDPYGLGAIADPSLFEDQTNPENNVVDWVRLELRKKDEQGNPSILVGRTAALVKRNGEVIAANGNSSIFFYDTFACDYYLSVFHRNHLAVMTENSIVINNDMAN